MSKYFIIIAVIIYLCLMYIFIKKETNSERHLTNEYSYAHFSQINKDNWYLTPSLIFTSPIHLTIQEGESLFIPKGWWHWIETFGPSIAINFWCENSNSFSHPKLMSTTFQKPELHTIITKHLQRQKNVIIWDSKTDEIYKSPKLSDNNIDNKYIISLPGYEGGNNVPFDKKLNNNLYSLIEQYTTTPRIFNNKKVDMNFWISPGYHDTGLHYDDLDGILCVLQGTKKVTLYPPSDSCYLKPLSTLPHWAISSPLVFEYNTYTLIKELDPNNNFPSSRLLYESILSSGNKKILGTLTTINKSASNVVWGCKLQGNDMRWEFYFYHYTSDCKRSINNTHQNLYLDNHCSDSKHLEVFKQVYNQNNLIIHSFDIYVDSESVGEDIHLYYNNNSEYNFPFYGSGKTLKLNGDISFESNFIIDTQDNCFKNFYKYTQHIGSKDVQTLKHKKLIYLYKCQDSGIWNKRDDQIFIQYLGISIDDFIHFLKTHKYPKQFVNHVISNKDKYKNIKNEITIVFDKKTLTPIRSGFYGLL